MGVEVSEMVSFPPVAVASVDHASEDWPVRLRLKGLPGRHAEFNGDYIRQRELRAHVLACWRLEHGTCYMYLKSCPLVCFARSWTDVEQGEFFLSASLPSLQPALLWAGHLSHWELEGASASSKISLRPVLGRWDSLAPDLSMSQRPVSRRNETEAVQAGSITLPYTKGRCHQWAQNAAVAELVQNWKDEIDAGAERSGHTISDVKVCCSLKRDRSHLAVRTYHAVVCEAGSEEFILLGTMEVREENSSLALTLTNFSDKMFVEMLWDGWAGKDKQQGKRRGQFGDGLQSAVCVLSRETDIDLKILSSGHIWSFDWSFPSEVAKAHGKEALRVTTKVCNQNLIGFDCKIDTRIKVTGLQKAAFEESQFLFLCPPYEVISNTSGEILLCDDFRGCMYVREMRVLQHENRAGVVSNRQGLNITSQIPGQSRDRIGFLGEAAKSAQTFCIWMDALAGNNREVAELLYDALSDRHSLEARAFFQYATQTNQVLPSYAQLLADVCAARFPHAFPILETDYKGHKIVTQKLKKNAVNISEKLFAVLRRAPNFRTPEEYWKMQQEELAKSAERIPWTDKYDCAVRIVQAALRTQVSYEVAYDSDPGDDLSITVSGTPPEQKLVVSKVSADGPASRACIGVGSELVGRDFSDGTERITCHRLKSTIFQCRERTLSVLARMEGWRCPFKLQFLLRPAELNEQQFSLVSRDDLEVPFVTLPGQVSWGAAATRLQAAKFIINAAGCRFHDASNSYHCPYFATQGACFCGVDHLLAAVLDDLEKTFNIHLNKVQKQWVDVEKNRLLQKHEKVYKLHKQQVVLRPPRAEPGTNGAYLQEEAQRLLQSYLSGNTGNLTEEDRKVLHMVRLVVAELETRQWEKTKTGHPQVALLGSQVIQFALAVRSAIQGVSVKGQRNIYKERLCTEALGAGRQDAGEQVENRVGRIPTASLEKLSSMLEPFLSHVVAHNVPPGSHSVLTILDDGIQAQTPVRIERSTEPLQILLLRQSLLKTMIHLHMHLRGTKNSFEASSQYWRSNRGTKFISPF